MPEDLVRRTVELPGGEIRLLQPEESAELPDEGPVEWAPIAPYWSVLWRSGIALAQELEGSAVSGLRVLELGCGLGVPSIAAARAGADVLATDACPEAPALLERNARENGVALTTATVDWSAPEEILRRAPFDLVLGSDLLYEQASVEPLLALLPRLASAALLAHPRRQPAGAFIERASQRWEVDTRTRGVIQIHRLRFP